MPTDPLTGLALARALYDAGLAPPEVGRPPCPPGVLWRSGMPNDPWHVRTAFGDWEPHRRLADCWFLRTRFGLNISQAGVVSAPGTGIPPDAATDVSEAALCEAICRMALAVHRWRQREGEPHT